MGRKNLHSKKLKRVDGDIYLAPPPLAWNRPSTRGVALKRCSNETRLGSTATSESGQTVSTSPTRSVFQMAEMPSSKGWPYSSTVVKTKHRSSALGNISAGALDTQLNSAGGGQNPREYTRASVLSAIYDLRSPLLPLVDVLNANKVGCLSTESSLCKVNSDMATEIVPNIPETAATIGTDGMFLGTVTTLENHRDMTADAAGVDVSESDSNLRDGIELALYETPVIVSKEQISITSVPQPDVLSTGIIISNVSGLPTDPPKSHNDFAKLFWSARTPTATADTSSSTSATRYAGGDSASASTPSDLSSDKQGLGTGKCHASTPPTVPPQSAATSCSDKPPISFSFRRIKPRPRSIITNKWGKSSVQLANTASLPNAIIVSNEVASPQNSHIEVRGDRLTAPGGGNVDGNGNIVHDANNNETSAEINNNIIIKAKVETTESKSGEFLKIVSQLDPKGVENATQVEVKMVTEEEEEVNSQGSSMLYTEMGSEEITNDYYGEEEEEEGEGETESYPVTSYTESGSTSEAPKTPFLRTEKGAIRFHLPGRIQHKTTIKVAHFPTGEEKKVTVNLPPSSCPDYDDVCANNQNFMMPYPLYNPYSYPYGGYPYPPYYGYPPYR